MKLLHTSDWHLGARLGRHDRLQDQHKALVSLIAQAELRRPDLILHTGDLFDAARPPYHALQLAVRALTRLSAIAPTVVLAGNHDSPALFKALHELASLGEPRRLWMLFEHQVLSVPQLADVAVACVPFVRPSAIADLARGDATKFEGTYADGIRLLNETLIAEATSRVGKRGIVLYAAHLHVHGAAPGKSERRITVGDDYATHVDSLRGAMYAAFGHIHDPQLLPGGQVIGRYAGSLVALDYGEAKQRKKAMFVELGDDVDVEEFTLEGGRPLVQFNGTVEELQVRAKAGAFDDVILKGRVSSEEPIIDLADRLAQWSPNCAVFDLINTVTRRKVVAVDTSSEAEAEPPLDALFREWRATSARADMRQASDAAVEALFGEALGLPDIADLGVNAVVVEANEALDAMTKGL